jgi:DNA polymerase-3 subunit alpha
MAICEVEDQTGSIEVVLFPETYDASAERLEEDAIVKLNGKIDQRNDRIQMVVNSVAALVAEEEKRSMQREVHLRLPNSGAVESDIRAMHRLRELLDEFPGDDAVYLYVPGAEHEVALRASFGIDWCGDLERALREILGQGALHVVERAERQEPRLRLLTA